MISVKIAVAVAMLTVTSASAGDDADLQSLARAAAEFYGVYMTLHPSDGIPDASERAKFEPFVSPSLDKLFAESRAAEDRYAKVTNHQSPPLVEGDPFTPNFEGATSYKIGACATDGKGGHCAVTLRYDDRKDKPISWTDTAHLVRTSAGWRVDDIVYGGNGDFGNKGRLTTTLEDAIANGNAFSK